MIKIKINNKEFKVTANIKFGTLIKLESNSDDPDIIRLALKEMLIPTPTDKQVDNFRQLDILEIMHEFSNKQKDLISDFKKKRG